MSPAPGVLEVLASVARRLDLPATYRELQAGLTNTSYLVDVNGRPHVLRIDTPHAQTLGLDRELEYRVQRRAADAGLAPAIVAAEPAAGWVVYEYLPGRALVPGDLADRKTLEAIAALLRAVHALPVAGRTLSVTAAASRYAAVVEADRQLLPFARGCVEVVVESPPADDVRCCHNDIVAGNLISNGRLRLIDWEYACDNEPLFDLASLAGYHDLDERAVTILLGAYAGGHDRAMRERLERQRRLFDALQWLWLAAQQVLAPNDAQRRRLTVLERRIA